MRREAKRSGRSQQDVIRDAIARQLGVGTQNGGSDDLAALVATGAVRAPRTPPRRPAARLALAHGVDSMDLLDREDRI